MLPSTRCGSPVLHFRGQGHTRKLRPRWRVSSLRSEEFGTAETRQPQCPPLHRLKGLAGHPNRRQDYRRQKTIHLMLLRAKKKVRSLHQLGRCYLLRGVDYMDFPFTGIAMPKKFEYDGVCRLCARDGVRDGEDSSATVSSSSSSRFQLNLSSLPITTCGRSRAARPPRPRLEARGCPSPFAMDRGNTTRRRLRESASPSFFIF